MDKKITGLMATLLLAVFAIGLSGNNSEGIVTPMEIVPETTVLEPINYGSNVCVSVNDEFVGCQHNVITTNGLNYVKDCIGNGGTNDINTLALGNTTAPVVGETALAGLWASCGLTKAEATYNTNGDGNWSQAYTWTSTCDNVVVNTTALYKLNTVEGMFAGGALSAPTTLQTNDKLQINYTTWVS